MRMRIKLLVSPLAKGAYFASYLDVARSEFHAHYPDCDVVHERIGRLDFLQTELNDPAIEGLARLSFVQGVFRDDGQAGLVPLCVESGFALPEELVFGVKYQGKTNELVTQFAINLGLQYRRDHAPARRLFDPMAGRGTTLLWALRYGLDGIGIEIDPAARQALHRHVKKQAKLHRLKHEFAEGYVGRKNKEGIGRFATYDIGGHSLKLITGDSRASLDFVGRKRADLIVTDLPYGVRFKGSSGRSPMDVIADCAEGWFGCLRPGGAMVLIFNAYQPKREDLAELFASLGAHVEPFSSPHRMSESIVRDLLIVTKPIGQ